MSLKVQKKQCATCIYREDSPLDLERLEGEIADEHGGFNGHRICHHAHKCEAVCAGFWARHKNKFQLGQIAQRLGLVEFVNVDELPKQENSENS